MKRLENISWTVKENGDVHLVDAKNITIDARPVFLFRGKGVPKNITLKTLAKKSISENIQVMATGPAKVNKDGSKAYPLGPLINVYPTMVMQGIIVEHEPEIVL